MKNTNFCYENSKDMQLKLITIFILSFILFKLVFTKLGANKTKFQNNTLKESVQLNKLDFDESTLEIFFK
jgi:hypothetical protein